jgi:hypothetical protein
VSKSLQAEPKRSAVVTPQKASSINLPDQGRIASLALEEVSIPQVAQDSTAVKAGLDTDRIAGMVPRRLVERARQIRMKQRLSDSSMIEEGLKLLFESRTDEEVADYLRSKGHRLRRS